MIINSFTIKEIQNNLKTFILEDEARIPTANLKQIWSAWEKWACVVTR